MAKFHKQNLQQTNEKGLKPHAEIIIYNNNNLFSSFYKVYDYMTHFDMVRLLMFRVRLIMLICIQRLLSSAVKLPLRKEGVWL